MMNQKSGIFVDVLVNKVKLNNIIKLYKKSRLVTLHGLMVNQ